MSDPVSEDERRYKIYFQINDQDSYGFGKLTTPQYVKLKCNDAAAYEFILDLFKAKKISIAEGGINASSRSIDDVDYTPVLLPEKTRSTSPSSAEVSGSCNTVNSKDNPKVLITSTAKREHAPNQTSDEPTVQSETVAIVDSNDEDQESDLSSQPSRTKKGSEAWKYFKKENKSSARCMICHKVLKHSGNTTNLIQHLNRKHALLCQSVGERKRKSSESSNESGNNHSEVKRMHLATQGNRRRPMKEAFERMTSFGDGGPLLKIPRWKSMWKSMDANGIP